MFEPGRAALAAIVAFTITTSAAVAATPPVKRLAIARPAPCAQPSGTAFEFGRTRSLDRSATFTTTVAVTCPPNVAFSLSFRSVNRCTLQSSQGAAVAYEIFADPQYRVAVLTCGGGEAALHGAGAATFRLYGRTRPLAPGTAAGDYSDHIITELAQ